MSIATAASPAQNPFMNSATHRYYSVPICRNPLKASLFPSQPFSPACFLRTHQFLSRKKRLRFRVHVSLSGEGGHGSVRRDAIGQLSLDAFLSVAEVLCIAPSAIFSICCIASSVLPGKLRHFQLSLESRTFAWQFLLLVVAVAIGTVIRQRQWRRICRGDGGAVDLLLRIEKVEEDLRSSATIVRVLSRQLEKLGVRFRVTRKALKEPIAETAALAQKNSEATRVLAMQEDILEKELGEIQKVLLAMQEQQEKQLELILAIGKVGKLLDDKRDAMAEQSSAGTRSSILEKKQSQQLEVQAGKLAGGDNNRP